MTLNGQPLKADAVKKNEFVDGVSVTPLTPARIQYLR